MSAARARCLKRIAKERRREITGSLPPVKAGMLELVKLIPLVSYRFVDICSASGDLSEIATQTSPDSTDSQRPAYQSLLDETERFPSARV